MTAMIEREVGVYDTPTHVGWLLKKVGWSSRSRWGAPPNGTKRRLTVAS